jgi:hypothetical protein
VRLNRLFHVYRSRHEAEQSTESVAISVSRLIGRTVSASEISALRTPASDPAPPDLIKGLVTHFGVPEYYLLEDGPRTIELDRQLCLLAAARDAGVRWLALRGESSEQTVEKLLEIIARVPAEDM